MEPARSPRLPLLLLYGLVVGLFAGTLLATVNPTAGAQGQLPVDYQATLAQVRAHTSDPGTIQIQPTADGGVFVDLQGRHQLVLLARTDAQGNLITRCVESVEQAAAFLSGSAPLLAEPVNPTETAVRDLVERTPLLRRAALAASQTMITINVQDSPGEGFNDPTPVTPVGGNPGTTLGAQRLIAFQYAASIWATYLQSTVPIVIDASFDPFGCGILGMAGPQALFADFTPNSNYPGPAYSKTLYVEALANKRAGRDLSLITNDIVASFNSAIGTASCPGSGSWYYGLDNQEPQGSADLVAVLMHEIGHGLGFLSLVGKTSGIYGRNYPYDPNPANNLDDIWNYFLLNTGTGTYLKDMSVVERARAITNTNALVWDGPLLQDAARSYLAATPTLTITAPSTLSGNYTVGTATFGAPIAAPPIAGDLVAAIDSDSDGAASDDTIYDACSPLTNSAAVAGRIALIDRGNCTFVSKVRHAQEAGAIAALIANNQAGVPPTMSGDDSTITIVAISISQADGVALRAALGSTTVSGQIGPDTGRLAGADSAGRMRMYAPSPIEPGSSVSHFDVSAMPNLLMEPSINSDIGEDVDLTEALLRDIGWYPDINFNGVPDTSELDLALTLTAEPRTGLSLGSPVALTLTVTSNGLLGSSAARLVADFPTQLDMVSWSASYSGGASGPPSGSGDIEQTLAMPAGSQAVFVVQATIVGEALSITTSASVTANGPEIDMNPANNQASVSLSIAAETLLLPLVAR